VEPVTGIAAEDFKGSMMVQGSHKGIKEKED